MTNPEITTFQTCPDRIGDALGGTPKACAFAGGHVWKSAHAAALDGLGHLVRLQLESRVQVFQGDAGELVHAGAVLERHHAVADPIGHRLLVEAK